MRRSFPVDVAFAITHPWSRPARTTVSRGPAALDVRRTSAAAQVRQGRLDPAGGEVGAALTYLLHRGELGVADLARLLADPVGDGVVVLAAVEDQAHGVVPAAPRWEPVGEQELTRLQVECQLLLHLAGGGQLRRLADLDHSAGQVPVTLVGELAD